MSIYFFFFNVETAVSFLQWRCGGVTVTFPPYPHCDTVTLLQPSSCTVAFAAPSICGTHPLNDLQCNTTDWLSSPHQATSVKQHCLNNMFFSSSFPPCLFLPREEKWVNAAKSCVITILPPNDRCICASSREKCLLFLTEEMVGGRYFKITRSTCTAQRLMYTAWESFSSLSWFSILVPMCENGICPAVKRKKVYWNMLCISSTDPMICLLTMACV